MARSKKEQKEEVVEKTFEEKLAEIDSGRQVMTTQLEEGVKTLRTLQVKKVGKQFTLSFITTEGDSYSRKLNGKSKKEDNSYWQLFAYFRTNEKTLKLPDESWIMFRHAEKDIYRCFHPLDAKCEALRALGFEEAPFSIKSWMNICVDRDLLDLFTGFGTNISFSPVEVIFDSRNRRMIIPQDSTKMGLEMDMDLD